MDKKPSSALLNCISLVQIILNFHVTLIELTLLRGMTQNSVFVVVVFYFAGMTDDLQSTIKQIQLNNNPHAPY